MSIWVAYNSYGDLIADGYSYDELACQIAEAGYSEDEVMIGRVSP